jgi:hypothetical protein
MWRVTIQGIFGGLLGYMVFLSMLIKPRLVILFLPCITLIIMISGFYLGIIISSLILLKNRVVERMITITISSRILLIAAIWLT